MHLKQRFFPARCLCHEEHLEQELPGGKTNQRFKCIVYNTNTKIMKYQLYINTSKKIDDLRL